MCMPVESIWGVYHADGGLIGEIKYVAGALLKGQHCSLCDITHKIAWEKSDMYIQIEICILKIKGVGKRCHLKGNTHSREKLT